MFDNALHRGPAEGVININDDSDVQYWSEKFRCSEDQLRAAVSRVGVSIDAVEQYLNI